MTSAPFDPHHRPDQARFARTTVGMASPLWFPFLMAASAGAAWWTYTNWARVGVQPRAGAGEGDSAPTPAPAPVPEATAAPVAASSALAESLGVQGAADEPETSADEDVSDLIDAAYAANLGPVPEPPANKRAAAKRPSAKKTAAKKAAAKKTTPAKTSAKAPAKKTAAKKTAAKKRGS